MFDRYRSSFLWTEQNERFLRCDLKLESHAFVFEKYKSYQDQNDVILEEQVKHALEECGNMMSDKEIQSQYRNIIAGSEAKA